VAVVIVDWNAGELLARCLAALDRQTRRPDRTVVVDNASSVETRLRLGAASPTVEVVRLAENRGFAAGANAGLAHAAGQEWIALLNPDAFPEPDWLERLLAAAAANPGFSSFGSRQLAADAPGRLDGTGDVYAVSGLAWRRDHGAAAEGVRLQPEEVFGPCAAAALYRRAALVEAGGLDESFFCYFEDVDLAFRLRLLGHRCLYVPDAIVHHVGSAVSGRQSEFAVYHGHRNLVWTWLKNMPAPLLLAYLPHHLALTLTSLVHVGRRGQARTLLRAKRDALRQLPRVLRARRQIQARRRISARDLRRAMVGGPRALGLGRFGDPTA
jgi:GT2 family glycosyltransferase